ncbi:sodium:solute symporter family transporter [Nitrososphaera sp. AFS]|uniref:sodium:solute symporter family transporter n=1 Tax=Nitrososphaera sp. AFS TaxID=2301191 RepID=UPI0013923D32|nr:sodium/solute symporter [Nitrososphaera sp. AFS]NAL77199.1 urea active transporter [Nitrososphaera sp. AFS]
MEPFLSQSIGYAIVLGMGLVMAVAVTILVKIETKWLGTKKTSEWFYTAGRTVKTGLVASSVVSAWTWAATLLQSSSVAYQFGISGPFWYAAGASIQIVLFAILAVELKRKAPSSHTFPEIIRARFGNREHKVFLFFGLMTNTIVTAMLVLGGAAVVNSLTGINIYIAVFLIPLGVIFYTFFGGLKATFFADYLNASFIFVVVIVFVITIYFVNHSIGGISGMYHKLSTAAALKPVEGNSSGAYLTMASFGALIFGIINIVGNFGTVFVNQSYWQRAIAARPRSAVKGFLTGGLAWFAIPFTLATTLGLSAVATGVSLTPEQISSGLVAPTAASHVLGDLGAVLLLTILFTAVTSAGSAELVAVSSLVTYDIYRTYVKPAATGRELIKISRISILGFGVGMGILASILFNMGASLEYLYLAMGILIGSAVIPLSLSVVWKKTNRNAATSAAIAGLVSGILAWVFTSNFLYGHISIVSTGQILPLLIGNILSISTSAAITLIGSLVKPDDFNFNTMKQKILVADDKIRSIIQHDSDEKLLKSTSRLSYRYGIALALTLVIVWPLPFYFSGYVFSLGMYQAWIFIAVSWAIGAATWIVLLPLIEARHGIFEAVKKISAIVSLASRTDLSSRKTEMNLVSNFNYLQGDIKRILVAVDGSVASLRAINYAGSLFEDSARARIYILNVIEWTNEDEESIDSLLVSKMEEEGRKMLKSIIIPEKKNEYERIVRHGDPASKIAELAQKLDVEMILMGSKGLGNAEAGIGHVSAKVLRSTTKPVVLLNNK